MSPAARTAEDLSAPSASIEVYVYDDLQILGGNRLVSAANDNAPTREPTRYKLAIE